MAQTVFRDRSEAGRLLATKLFAYAGEPDVVVLGLPRGGVPVAFEVAQVLAAPLDVFLVRKLGVPGHEELAMGAVASGGVRVLNHDVVDRLGIAPEEIDAVVAREVAELARREQLYRGGRPPPEVDGHTVILVDDGLATGARCGRRLPHYGNWVRRGSLSRCRPRRATSTPNLRTKPMTSSVT